MSRVNTSRACADVPEIVGRSCALQCVATHARATSSLAHVNTWHHALTHDAYDLRDVHAGHISMHGLLWWRAQLAHFLFRPLRGLLVRTPGAQGEAGVDTSDIADVGERDEPYFGVHVRRYRMVPHLICAWVREG